MAAANSRLDPEAAAALADVASRLDTPDTNAAFVLGYLASIVMTGVATLVAYGLESGAPVPNLSLVYVIPVIVAGMSFGMGPSLFAAVLGALAYNFFFTEPRFSLMVDDPANIWAIALLFIVGVIVSTIAFGAKRRAAAITLLNREIAGMQDFSRDIAAAADSDTILTVTSQALMEIFEVPAAVVVMKNGEIQSSRAAGALKPETADFAAAKFALDMGAASRARVYPAQEARFDFWPAGHSAAIGLAFGAKPRPAAQNELVDIVRNMVAMAMDRVGRG